MGAASVQLAVDGGGFSTYNVIVGSFTGFNFGVGPHTPITIETGTSQTLKAGKCNNCWFIGQMNVGDGQGEFLRVNIVTDGNSSCNFSPPGLEGYHVNPGSNVTLSYSRSATGNLEARLL